jgi:hypothetical protein
VTLIGNTTTHVEVAHIIPYGLTKSEDGGLDETKQSAIIILNMIDHGVVHLIEGADINRPYNGITLSLDMHKSFGQYEIFFDRMPDSPPCTYRIGTFLPPGLVDWLPTTRTLFTHPTIDSPSERLLGVITDAPVGPTDDVGDGWSTRHGQDGADGIRCRDWRRVRNEATKWKATYRYLDGCPRQMR